MALAGMRAGDEGVQPFDAMREAVFHKEIQRAISRGRLGGMALGGENVEDVIGPKRPMLGKQNLQNPLPRRRQAKPRRQTSRFGGTYAVGDAASVVVCLETDHPGLICYTITISKPRMRLLISLLSALSPVAVWADAPRVAADTLPVHGLVAQVMDGLGVPDLIMPADADPHHHSMRPSEAAALEKADLVVWIGPALTPWLETPLDNLARGAARLELLDVEGTHLIESDDEHEEHDDHDTNDDHDDEHAHGPTDPHAWLDPRNAAIWLDAIAAALSELDPANAATYRDNAAAAVGGLADLEAEMLETLAPLAGREFAVYHDSLRYLGARFGLAEATALLDSEADRPSPRRIASLIERVESASISVVFAEPGTDTALLDTVFGGRPFTVCYIDLLGSGVAPGPDHYRQSLIALAETMGGCGTGR